MRKRKTLLSLLLWAAIALLFFASIDERLIVRRYTIETDKVDAPVRLAVLTDLHGCDYGENGAELVALIEAEQPDAILLVGDMFSADGDPREELATFRALNAIAFTYYVTGNHEYWEYDVPALCEMIEATGVHVLDQNCIPLNVDGQRLNICGVPDPYANVSTWDALTSATGDIYQEGFTLLMAHRPELIDQYAAKGTFDLVVSGHAHGGQVRIPGLVNGLYAPNQGFFPQYAGGQYEVDGTTMIVSRGLSRQRQWYIPRVFNRPELVFVIIE